MKFSQVPTNSSPADTDALMGVTSGGVDGRFTFATLLTWLKSKTAWLTSSNVDWTTNGKIWWEEIGRATLAVAGDTITVSGLPARKHLRVLIITLNSGATSQYLELNNDSANNYVWRVSSNGAADSSFTANPSLLINSGSYNILSTIDIINMASREKAFIASSNAINTAGASNVPGRSELMGKWVNTSVPISTVKIFNLAAGDFAAGSEVVVLGHD